MLDRRSVLKGFVQAPFAAAPLAAILASPQLARAVAAGLQDVAIETADGTTVRGVLALPAATPAPAMLLVHEWWGLNDSIKVMAAEFAKEGYVALACDLYKGNVASDPTAARLYMQQVDAAEATATLAAWVDWLKAHEAATGKVGTVGWCFGGGWSLNASLARPVEATVVYYGNVAKSAAELAPLAGPALGHFATRDNWITETMVGKWEDAMQAAGKTVTAHRYEADHGFANPTSARYDKEDAMLAWKRTLAFLTANLQG
jgi:carboxymethylenebutenolidase